MIQKVNKGVKTLLLVVDVLSVESVKKAFATIDAKGLNVNALINNAGSMSDVVFIEDSDPEGWWYNFEVNVKGTFLVTRQYLKHLNGKEGTIANASTISAILPTPTYSGFGISKMAEDRFTEYVAFENPNVFAYSYYPGN